LNSPEADPTPPVVSLEKPGPPGRRPPETAIKKTVRFSDDLLILVTFQSYRKRTKSAIFNPITLSKRFRNFSKKRLKIVAASFFEIWQFSIIFLIQSF
jgi:hypothetical protein